MKNKSPVLYEESSLGLESWCVKHIYKYAYHELFNIRKMLCNKKLPRHKMENLNHLLVGVLLINPDVYTFWNMKRELIEQDVLNVFTELAFTKLVLSYKSKSNETFAYRRWLLSRILSKLDFDNARMLENILITELEITEIAAEKAQNNYHAWNHRMWSFDIIRNKCDLIQEFINNELQFSTTWMFSHVSEYSSYHYRSFLYKCVLDNGACRNSFDKYYNYVKNILQSLENVNYVIVLRELFGPWDTIFMSPQQDLSEVNQCIKQVNYISVLLYDLFYTLESLFRTFPDHESIWCYRRCVIYHILQTIYRCLGMTLKTNIKINEDFKLHENNKNSLQEGTCLENGEKLPKLFKYEPNKIESCLLYNILVKGERKFIAQSISNKCSDLTVSFAKKYQKWLQMVLQLYDV